MAFDHEHERVFLLSTTHGAETHGLAAAIEVMRIHREEGIAELLAARGERLRSLVGAAIRLHRLEAHVQLLGRPSNLVFATLDAEGNRSQPFRTLFLQELIEGGVLGPSFVVSAAHSEADIERTGEVAERALRVYRSALEDGIERHLRRRSVQPVMRPYA